MCGRTSMTSGSQPHAVKFARVRSTGARPAWNPGFMRMRRATPLQSPNLSSAEKLYVAGEAGAGVDGSLRLTGTPCEAAESCSTIWIGRTSGGTSNTSLTLT
jgi:hypothetical protein